MTIGDPCTRCDASTNMGHSYAMCLENQLAATKAKLEELRKAANDFAQCFPPTGKYDPAVAPKLRRLRTLLAEEPPMVSPADDGADGDDDGIPNTELEQTFRVYFKGSPTKRQRRLLKQLSDEHRYYVEARKR